MFFITNTDDSYGGNRYSTIVSYDNKFNKRRLLKRKHVDKKYDINDDKDKSIKHMTIKFKILR